MMSNNLQKFQMTMNPIPERIKSALHQGVLKRSFPDSRNAVALFKNWSNYSDQVIRADNGCVLVTCTTDLQNVTPAMVDWWFGWHLPFSERYQLWHPLAHKVAKVKEDRQHIQNDRARYIGNVSYVDEFIGQRLMRLAISFYSPESFGLDDVYKSGATAICAKTTDRILHSDGGSLIHFVVPTETGSEMRSAFWLGEIATNWPIFNGLMKPILNTATVRKIVVPDQMSIDLLQHCAEEMNHLARFLPNLYAAMNNTNMM